MSGALQTYTEELRAVLASEAENLAGMIRSLRATAEDFRTGAGMERAEAVARADDPVPTAALLLRVSRLRREAADASDEFRREMIAALGRLDRAREGEE